MSRKTILLSQACEGMIRYKQATGKSENRLSCHIQETLRLF